MFPLRALVIKVTKWDSHIHIDKIPHVLPVCVLGLSMYKNVFFKGFCYLKKEENKTKKKIRKKETTALNNAEGN